MKQTILITGGAGYIGSGVVKTFLEKDYQVVCVDNLTFGKEALASVLENPFFKLYACDIRDSGAMQEVFEQNRIDAIIHIAAIVGDPACGREPELAFETNWTASKWLLDEALKRHIKRFIFASTCSNYGKMASSEQFVNEDSTLAPVSLYAELKVKFEQYLLNEIEKRADFSPTALRFATVYGLSTRMRFDLTVNEFTKELALNRELTVFGEQFWRPYCHVNDFARAFLAVLEAPNEKIAYNVFNVGDTSENYTKQMIVDEIKKVLPTAKINYVHKNEDPRDYRVNFDKIKNELGFAISKRVPDGINEIITAIQNKEIKNPDEQRYYNIPVAEPV